MTSTMMALVYNGPGHVAWERRPKPKLLESTDAIVRVTTTTLCGTDLHILKGHVPTVTAGRVLGHEGVGVVESTGSSVLGVRPGDRVVITVISACGRCSFCRRSLTSHCASGGWVLGHRIDGTQAEYVRVPFADTGLHVLPASVRDDSAVMLSCALPTALECGVLSGHVTPGDRVAIIGAGPVGLAALLTAQLYAPAELIVLDLDDNRLDAARALGATQVVNCVDGRGAEGVLALTGGLGADVVIEAVGKPATFELCQGMVAVGGRIANMGVHGAPAVLHLERLWSMNVTLTTRLVDTGTVPRLLKMVESGRISPARLASHHLALPEIVKAYDLFENASRHRALKVVLAAGA